MLVCRKYILMDDFNINRCREIIIRLNILIFVYFQFCYCMNKIFVYSFVLFMHNKLAKQIIHEVDLFTLIFLIVE